MMDEDSEKQQIHRLREEQTKALDENERKISALGKFKEDYQSLFDRLTTLPDKVTHDVMIPFGSLAFMPGELIHTNEVMVLLGDNWFVERSAKQACEIITRRMNSIEESIESLQKQKGLLQPRLDFTANLQDMIDQKGDLIEIKEEYDAQKENQWRAQHRKNVQRYREKENRMIQQTAAEHSSGKNEQTNSDDADLWKRLDELERMELEGDELNRLSEEKKIDNDDESDISSSSSVTEENEESESESEDTIRPAVITFTHTNTLSSHNSSQAQMRQNLPTSEHTDSSIVSPSDIYQHFMQPVQPRSILKQTVKKGDMKSSGQEESKSVCFSDAQDSSASQNNTEKTEPPQRVQAFTGAVLERTPMAGTSQENTESQSAPKMSRFKAQRLQARR